MSTEPTPIDDGAAEKLVASYDAHGDTAGRQAEARAAAMMGDEFLLRAYERTSGDQGNAEADALLAEIHRRGLDA